MHNRLVESILTSKCHVIATLRAKMEHVQEKDPTTGKTVVKKIGMNPIQRDGMEYEFTVFIDVDQDHNATSSKDRTSLVDGLVFRPGVDTGKAFLAWLETGADVIEPEPEPVNWVGFWANVKKLGFTEAEAYAVAEVENIEDWSREKVTELLGKLKRMKQ